MSTLPKSLPRGTVYFYDESKPSVRWVGGLLEVEAWEADTGKKFSELSGVNDMRQLAYYALVIKGLIDPKKEPHDKWKMTVASIFDDEETAPEASAPATS